MNGKELTLGVVIAALVAAVLMTPAACTMRRHQLIHDAILRGGSDPIAVKCAIEADSGHSPACVAYAVRAK